MWIVLMCSPLVLYAQDDSKKIKRINRTLFEFKQEFLELKEAFLKKEQAWKEQQEQFELLVKKLQKESSAARQAAIKLRIQVEKFEEILEGSEAKQLGGDVKDIASLIDVLLYDELNEPQFNGALILNLINRHNSAISKDLLLFYLARYKHNFGESELALGYYGNILTDFPESRLISKTIYEMSRVFSEIGKDQEQKTLLLQLANQNKPDKYGLLAIKKLKLLGVDLPKSIGKQKQNASFPTETSPNDSEKKDDLDLDSLDFSFE